MKANLIAAIGRVGVGEASLKRDGTTKDLVAGSDVVFRPRDSKQLKGVPSEWALFVAAE